MVRFPHYIEYTPLPALPEGEEWVAAPGLAVTLPCRLSPNREGKTVETADGSLVEYSGIVYLALGSPWAAFGSTVKVYGDQAKTRLLATRTVKDCWPNQVHMCIWV